MDFGLPFYCVNYCYGEAISPCGSPYCFTFLYFTFLHYIVK